MCERLEETSKTISPNLEQAHTAPFIGTMWTYFEKDDWKCVEGSKVPKMTILYSSPHLKAARRHLQIKEKKYYRVMLLGCADLKESPGLHRYGCAVFLFLVLGL
jgi:hypothetical protein